MCFSYVMYEKYVRKHWQLLYHQSNSSCGVLSSLPPLSSQGASGAGKSTFLDLLAGKKTEGECAGQILLTRSSSGGRGGVGGWVRGNRSKDRRAAVYVPQDDFHVAELTVRESLAFAVRLGMGGDHVT